MHTRRIGEATKYPASYLVRHSRRCSDNQPARTLVANQAARGHALIMFPTLTPGSGHWTSVSVSQNDRSLQPVQVVQRRPNSSTEDMRLSAGRVRDVQVVHAVCKKDEALRRHTIACFLSINMPRTSRRPGHPGPTLVLSRRCGRLAGPAGCSMWTDI